MAATFKLKHEKQDAVPIDASVNAFRKYLWNGSALDLGSFYGFTIRHHPTLSFSVQSALMFLFGGTRFICS
jgi:hypothetical protein